MSAQPLGWRLGGTPGCEAYFRLADLTAALTMSFVDGAAAIVFGTGFFGFLASRFPCFFSEAMINLLVSLSHHRTI
ncbi:hypothetical protein [Methylobacterium nigriterrae]|uniref:hypothetical protein n=1 Tax=Methylobacterium nigriterrae TaxID=3127512 RepID=UPI003013B91A